MEIHFITDQVRAAAKFIIDHNPAPLVQEQGAVGICQWIEELMVDVVVNDNSYASTAGFTVFATDRWDEDGVEHIRCEVAVDPLIGRAGQGTYVSRVVE